MTRMQDQLEKRNKQKVQTEERKIIEYDKKITAMLKPVFPSYISIRDGGKPHRRFCLSHEEADVQLVKGGDNYTLFWVCVKCGLVRRTYYRDLYPPLNFGYINPETDSLPSPPISKAQEEKP